MATEQLSSAIHRIALAMVRELSKIQNIPTSNSHFKFSPETGLVQSLLCDPENGVEVLLSFGYDADSHTYSFRGNAHKLESVNGD